MKHHTTILGCNSCTPREVIEAGDALRPSFQRILDLLDLDDPAWPATAAVLREMIDAGVDLDDATVATAVKIGAKRYSESRADTMARPDAEQPASVSARSIVYYIRRGNLVKIGTTVSPEDRFGTSALLPDAILAFEPGDMSVESMRHRQFRHLRCQGEYFLAAPELLAHIDRTRELHGAPDTAWPTIATAAQPRPPATRAQRRSAELVTGPQALRRFGIPASTLRTWVQRGWLCRAGREGKYNLYYADDLRRLRVSD